MLKSESLANSAVIINEFGEVGIDHHLVETADDTIIELSNGCLCCTVRGKLVETIENLIERNPARILIETTGLADPVPVLQALVGTPSLIGAISFQGLFTVFDATIGFDTIGRQREAGQQLSLADVIIVSKLDLVENTNDGSDNLTKIEAATRTINPVAKIFDRKTFIRDLDNILQLKITVPVPAPVSHHHHSHNINRHSETISATILQTEIAMKKSRIEMFLDLLISAHGDHILRIKGLVNCIGETRPMVIQGVGRVLSQPAYLEKWPDSRPATALVVFLDGLEAEFVQRLFHGFLNTPVIDTPDEEALVNNPLSIAGFKPSSK